MKRDSSTRSSDSDKASSDKLKAALKKVEVNPNDEKAWDEVETIAAESQSPDGVADAYRAALRPGIKPDALASLGQRALRFAELSVFAIFFAFVPARGTRCTASVDKPSRRAPL